MKVFIVTGSSGGQIFSAVSLAEELIALDQGTQVLLLLPERSNLSLDIPAGCAVAYSKAPRMVFAFSRSGVKSLLGLSKAAWQDMKVLLSFKPDVVVGFGSIDSVCIIFLAWFFRIKTIIHEQNVMPGKANRLLAKLVDKVAVSFEETLPRLRVNKDKLVLTGNPLREGLSRLERKAALGYFGFQENKFTLLVVGGSQGSSKVNSVFADALSAFPAKENLQLIHLSGKQDSELLKMRYAKEGVRAQVFDFFPQMHYAYSAANLVICRAGATTISELIFFGLPAVLLPYPYAYAHQMANARVLSGAGCALIIEDAKLNAENIKSILTPLVGSTEELARMRQCYDKFKSVNAAEKLALEVSRLNAL
jgi:UDP-N-acetylglucosamine--N-acetylmuramyl-(pentapeptide) pyrophosphoryl-undecaprenol N-acetylglucosamine transferase